MFHPRYSGANAQAFADGTWNADLSEIRNRFIGSLPPQATRTPTILDLGCGSGRDALAFREMGFVVFAMDPSPDMVEIARSRAAVPVSRGGAEDLQDEERFDGIWACASLLHIRKSDLGNALERIRRALIPGGVLYASFKWGEGEREVDGLHFSDLDPVALGILVDGVAGLELVDCWRTEDVRPEMGGHYWLNGLMRRPFSP